METITYHSSQGSYPTVTKNFFCPPPRCIYVDAICVIWKESISGLSKRSRLKMLTDGRGTTDIGCLYDIILLAHGSDELK